MRMIRAEQSGMKSDLDRDECFQGDPRTIRCRLFAMMGKRCPFIYLTSRNKESTDISPQEIASPIHVPR